MLCLGMHSNVMHRFMVQAFQDPPLCSSTFLNQYILIINSELFACFFENTYCKNLNK
jgi:hypothetical protein